MVQRRMAVLTTYRRGLASSAVVAALGMAVTTGVARAEDISPATCGTELTNPNPVGCDGQAAYTYRLVSDVPSAGCCNGSKHGIVITGSNVILDGNGHTIKGCGMTPASSADHGVDISGAGATVKNVTISETSSTQGFNWGIAVQANNGTLTNVTVSAVDEGVHFSQANGRIDGTSVLHATGNSDPGLYIRSSATGTVVSGSVTAISDTGANGTYVEGSGSNISGLTTNKILFQGANNVATGLKVTDGPLNIRNTGNDVSFASINATTTHCVRFLNADNTSSPPAPVGDGNTVRGSVANMTCSGAHISSISGTTNTFDRGSCANTTPSVTTGSGTITQLCH